MSTTMEDVKYEMYLQDISDEYQGLLVQIAHSSNEKELKKSLKNFDDFRDRHGDFFGDEGSSGALRDRLGELATVQDIAVELKEAREDTRKARRIERRWKIATLILSLISLSLAIRTALVG